VTMRRSIVIAIAATVVITATFLLRAGTRTPPTFDPPPHPTATLTPRAIAPVDEPTALDVALRAIRLTGEIATAGFITRDDLIESVASTRFAATLRSTAAAQLIELTTAIGAAGVPASDVLWEELPLTARTNASNQTAASVTVWSVLIVGVPGYGSARQVWRTSTIDLVREPDGWRVDSWTATPGPTPTLATTGAISDLASIVEVLNWPTATAGVA
jgi:hypothetical protein